MDPKYARANYYEPGHIRSVDTTARADGGLVLNLADLTDEELAAAASAGDSEMYGVLVARVSPMLLRYLHRMVDDPQTAEDLAQDTLLDAWRGLPDFAFRSTFKTWMFAIAHRKTVDYRRKRREIPTADDRFVDMATAQPLPSDEALRRSLVEALRAELRTLPQTSRAVWWLREVEGLALDEIARVLQLSSGSVRGHLQRARKYLASRLEPWRPGRTPERPPPGPNSGDDDQQGAQQHQGATSTGGSDGGTSRQGHTADIQASGARS